MLLTKLEIFGFKSFATKQVFKFSEGISAFVGPNGCGKTNVIDAIRWVLGEQRSSILRSDIMENVIFNGTSNIKPLSFAEVALTIENNKGKLPSEYAEVTITRRLFRNGESQYLLNNTQCRLRDIQDLFMDTGIGADSYSVIELKMVEQILNGKPEERRHLFEEAAGVTKYKIRRKEAAKKLQSVQNDLVRIEDIIQEVQKQVNTLSRQAAKTKRYNKLLEQMKDLEKAILKVDFLNYSKNYQEIHQEIEKFQIEKDKQAIDIEEYETQLVSQKKHLSSIEIDYKTVLDEFTKVESAIASIHKEIAVSDEKVKSIEISNNRMNNEINELANSKKRSNSRLSELEFNIESLKKCIIENKNQLEELVKNRNEAKTEVDSSREKKNKFEQELNQLNNQKSTFYNTQKRTESQKNNLENRKRQSENEIERLEINLSKLDEEREKFVLLREDFAKKIKDIEKELSEQQEREKFLQNKIQETQHNFSSLKTDLQSKRAALDFLNNIVDTSESSKVLRNSSKWQTKDKKYQLAELIYSDEKFRVAIDAALGTAGKFIVVENVEEALAGVQILKETNKGKHSFLCRELIKEITELPRIQTDENVFGWISEIVQIEETLRYALRAILGKTALVSDFDTAKRIVDEKIAETAVTLAGEIYSSNAFIRGGSALKDEGILIGKKERIDKLQEEIDLISDNIRKTEIELQNAKNELSKINIKFLNDQLRRTEQEKNQNEQKISEFHYKKESIQNSLENIKNNIKQHQIEIEQFQTEIDGFSKEIAIIDDKVLALNESIAIAAQEFKEKEIKFSELQNSAHSVEMQMVKNDTELKSTEKDIFNIKNNITNLERKTESLILEKENNTLQKENLLNEIEKLKVSLTAVQEKEILIKNKKDVFEEQISSLQIKVENSSNEISQRKKDFDRLNENIHNKKLKESEFLAAINNIRQRALENLEADIETVEYVPEENFSIENYKSALQSIKEKLGALGSVNFLALEEFDAQSNRLKFYDEQCSDLIQSEKHLQETISEINLNAERMFEETFKQINSNFQMLFTKLFGESGYAELKLSDGNVLEADIEINAKPPGKKPHSIDMLSGGEKTLTAISLLFGIYLVKPSPFCILDEVDAPLDDANNDRFLNLIREFSEETQFVFITHNKKTMEAASTLYGITMQEQGVSKVVSVKMV